MKEDYAEIGMGLFMLLDVFCCSIGGSIVYYFGETGEYRTVEGKIISVDPLPVTDRFSLSFSDGTTLTVDNRVLVEIDGYEGNMKIEFVRRIYHDSDYWSINKIVKLDSWVKP